MTIIHQNTFHSNYQYPIIIAQRTSGPLGPFVFSERACTYYIAIDYKWTIVHDFMANVIWRGVVLFYLHNFHVVCSCQFHPHSVYSVPDYHNSAIKLQSGIRHMYRRSNVIFRGLQHQNINEEIIWV